MELERSLSSSQKPATCPDPEAEPCSPLFPTDFFNILFDMKKKTIIFIFINSSVGIATRYWLDGPDVETQWRQIFRTCPARPCSPPSLQRNGYWVFPGIKAAGALRLPPTPHLALMLKKERTILGFHGLLLGEAYLYLYL